ncbi:hypothetical protein LAL4801_05700 [Roseibium aggregatum]|jgi:hypothetical protein|uniref:Uncharacterized protein n=1 Tax=Roseibium aggregatum TaxID=187304 RepID=A0A0M6YC29_9HYPH|nr:hypothetical protein LAL4801_05700 [Roseibium aggregatum]
MIGGECRLPYYRLHKSNQGKQITFSPPANPIASTRSSNPYLGYRGYRTDFELEISLPA